MNSKEQARFNKLYQQRDLERDLGTQKEIWGHKDLGTQYLIIIIGKDLGA